MTFDVGADAYDRFMGRFSEPLAVLFAREAGVEHGQRALDVGCGPGALTQELVGLLGADAVCAVDPSEPFVAAATLRLPGADVRRASAEALPFPDDGFDVTMSQLVVHFMDDPVAGLTEMRRVTVPGGTVSAAVWDLAGGAGPLAVFQRAVHEIDAAADDERNRPGGRAGHLEELCASAGLVDLVSTTLTVRLEFDSFDEWWGPFTLGVGPAGAHMSTLDDRGRDRLRRRCSELLGPAPFEVSAAAWCVRGTA